MEKNVLFWVCRIDQDSIDRNAVKLQQAWVYGDNEAHTLVARSQHMLNKSAQYLSPRSKATLYPHLSNSSLKLVDQSVKRETDDLVRELTPFIGLRNANFIRYFAGLSQSKRDDRLTELIWLYNFEHEATYIDMLERQYIHVVFSVVKGEQRFGLVKSLFPSLGEYQISCFFQPEDYPLPSESEISKLFSLVQRAICSS